MLTEEAFNAVPARKAETPSKVQAVPIPTGSMHWVKPQRKSYIYPKGTDAELVLLRTDLSSGRCFTSRLREGKQRWALQLNSARLWDAALLCKYPSRPALNRTWEQDKSIRLTAEQPNYIIAR